MLFNTEKFNKQIRELPKIMDSGDSLSKAEMDGIKERIMREIARGPIKETKTGFWTVQREKFLRYATSIVIGITLVGGTSFASDGSVPGDALYPFKRVKERVELFVAFSDQAKANLEAKFGQERLKELQRISGNGEANLGVGNAASSAAHIKFNASSTPGNKGEGNDKVKQQLNADFKHTLSALREVKTKLEAKGNANAAAKVGDVILKLEADAKAQHVLP